MTAPRNLSELQKAFAAHIRDPEHSEPPAGIEDRRMAIYRDLFYNNIQGFLASNFPVIRKLYADDDWRAMVRDFFVHHRAHTPLFPELPREFLRYLQDVRGEQPGDPPFLLELAHYEWVELALSLDEHEIDELPHEPDGDLLKSVPVVSPLAWSLSYRFPVHRIRPDFRPEAPPAEPTYLLVYRDRQDRVKFMALNPVSARLLSVLKDNDSASGLECLERIAEELSHPDPAKVIDAGRGVMEDFRQRDVVLGTRPD